MSQKNVELVIGKLATDEAFRQSFRDDADGTIAAFREAGHELTASEVAALLATDVHRCESFADAIDPRIQKARLGERCLLDRLRGRRSS